MLATILQLIALVGLPVGGFMASPAAGVAGLAISVGYVGLALDARRPSGDS